METTKYDNKVVDAFVNFKEQNLIAKYTEKASLKAILGNNLKNLSVLDIGCGFGYHSRWLADEGARVTGVDVSHDQIRKALEMETENPRGIRYGISDAGRLTLEKDQKFDICIMMYMIQSARNPDELSAYFRNAYDRLKNGGKVVGSFNQCYDSKIVDKYGYLFDRSAHDAAVGFLFTGESENDASASFVCRQIKVDKNLVESVGASAGFRRIVWHKPTVSKEGLTLMGDEFWRDFVNVPVDQYFVMQKIVKH